MPNTCEVLCIGASSFDITLSVAQHPLPDSKSVADRIMLCGGGPAANAAIALRRLGHTAAFLGYLGNDSFGDLHLAELEAEAVITEHIARDSAATPLSVSLAKPNGESSLVNYTESCPPLHFSKNDFESLSPQLLLFDGRHPEAAERIIGYAKAADVPSMLDAGSLHQGTEFLASRVDYLICAEKFAREYTQEEKLPDALAILSRAAPYTVITRGAAGLLWKTPSSSGSMSAYTVEACDGVGAGDSFHAALCASILRDMPWEAALMFASAAAAITVQSLGARAAFPSQQQVEQFMEATQKPKIVC